MNAEQHSKTVVKDVMALLAKSETCQIRAAVRLAAFHATNAWQFLGHKGFTSWLKTLPLTYTKAYYLWQIGMLRSMTGHSEEMFVVIGLARLRYISRLMDTNNDKAITVLLEKAPTMSCDGVRAKVDALLGTTRPTRLEIPNVPPMVKAAWFAALNTSGMSPAELLHVLLAQMKGVTKGVTKLGSKKSAQSVKLKAFAAAA